MQRCPICSTEVEESPRYPRYLCRACAAKAQSADGRPLKFFNVGMGGGFIGKYADEQVPEWESSCVQREEPPDMDE